MASCPCLHPHDDAAGVLFSTATTIVLHRFASLGLNLRIDARKRLFPRKTLHRFPSLALKSRIDAAVWLFLRVFLQRFPSLTPEIRNHCSRGVVAFCRRNRSSLRRRRLESATEERCSHGRCRRNRSSLRQRKTESDTDLVVATAAAGGPFFNAATKNGHF